MTHWVHTLLRPGILISSRICSNRLAERDAGDDIQAETTPTPTKSNLQLAIASKEMLEDALHNRGNSKDVGWRRSKPPGDPILEASKTRTCNKSQAPAPITGNGNGDASHSTSASLPSLPLDPTSPNPPSNAVSPNPNPNQAAHPRPRLEFTPSLRAELARERAARSALKAEVEALSAALFEEGNKMAATERRARAEMQEELHTVKTQRDALKQALRVVESENAVLRGGEWTPTSGHSRPSSVTGSPTS
ncbi:hypothetical protein EXIGLDRAFT_694290, partial [Exidia glandulosa HHB12029]